jgi:hypothetical protein
MALNGCEGGGDDMSARQTIAEPAAKNPERRAQPETVTKDASGDQTHRRGLPADGRKGILVRVAPEGWRQLRDLAAELTLSSGDQVTMQSLITEAINETLKKHGRQPVA